MVWTLIWVPLALVIVFVVTYCLIEGRRYYNSKLNKMSAFVYTDKVTYVIKKSKFKYINKRLFVLTKEPPEDCKKSIDSRIYFAFQTLLDKEYSSIINYHIHQAISKGSAFLSMWYTIAGSFFSSIKADVCASVLVSILSIAFVTLSVILMTISKIPGNLQAWRAYDSLSNGYIADARNIINLEDKKIDAKANQMTQDISKIENSISCDSD